MFLIIHLVLGIIILAIILPIVAMGKAKKAFKKTSELESELGAINKKLDELTQQLKSSGSKDFKPEQQRQDTSDIYEEKIIIPSAKSSVSHEVSRNEPLDRQTPLLGLKSEPDVTLIKNTQSQESILECEENINKETPESLTSTLTPDDTTSQNNSCNDPTQESFPNTLTSPAASIEERIGLVWFTRIGVLIAILVAAWFFKYMIDNEWIGPWGRIATGVLAGFTSLGLGEFLCLKKRTHPLFNQTMLGLGISILLITAYAASEFYRLITASTAFLIVVIVASIGGALSYRHKNQTILILSLIAVFINPVVLSTGKDRSLALFTYLLLTTSVVHCLSVIKNFKTAGYVALLGTSLLFAGWYNNYFDLSPALTVNTDSVSTQAGAYFSMAKRWIPLLFSNLFVIQWVWISMSYFKKGSKDAGRVFLISAAFASNAAMGLLLYDSPVILSCTLLALGAIFSWLLLKQRLSLWLFLIMAFSFLLLENLNKYLDESNITILFSIISVLAALYFSIFLKEELSQKHESSWEFKLFLAILGLWFFRFGIIFLMPKYYIAFALLTVFLSTIYLVLSQKLSSLIILIGTLITTFAGLLYSARSSSLLDWWLVGIIQLWFFAHLAIILWRTVKLKKEWTFYHLFSLCFTSLGCTALFLIIIPSDLLLARALLSLTQGLVFLGLGIAIAWATKWSKNEIIIPLMLSIFYFCAFWGFLLTGPALTIAWTIQAIAVIYLSTQIRNEIKLIKPCLTAASSAVFAAAAIHFFTVDYHWIADQQNSYLNSSGAEGFMPYQAFANKVAGSLFVLGTGLLLALYFIRAQKENWAKTFASIFMISGHFFILWLLVGELKLAFGGSPEIPVGLPKTDAMTIWNSHYNTLISKALLFQTITTMTMGVYALAIMGFGFAIREFKHRLLGMVLLCAALAKLIFYDLWEFELLYRIIAGGAVAVLLLFGGFLYAHFGNRIKTDVIEGENKAEVK